MEKEIYIGNIGNYYGGLAIKKENDKYYWTITGYEGDEYEEIPQYLFDALIKFKNESTN